MKNLIKKSLLTLGVGLLGLVATSQQAAAITIAFSSINNANVEFLNGNFYFNNNANGYSLDVDDSTGTGDSIGNFGAISGIFAIGNITATAIPLLGNLETAPVTGSGTMSIFDGSATLTGTVVWDKIATFGTGNALNVSGILNLTSITYAGGGSDLSALAAAGLAKETITLQFDSPKSLQTLKDATSPITTSFSGTIATPVADGGFTLALLGFALLGIDGLRRKLRA